MVPVYFLKTHMCISVLVLYWLAEVVSFGILSLKKEKKVNCFKTGVGVRFQHPLSIYWIALLLFVSVTLLLHHITSHIHTYIHVHTTSTTYLYVLTWFVFQSHCTFKEYFVFILCCSHISVNCSVSYLSLA